MTRCNVSLANFGVSPQRIRTPNTKSLRPFGVSPKIQLRQARVLATLRAWAVWACTPINRLAQPRRCLPYRGRLWILIHGMALATHPLCSTELLHS